jgi:hypothetical protein
MSIHGCYTKSVTSTAVPNDTRICALCRQPVKPSPRLLPHADTGSKALPLRWPNSLALTWNAILLLMVLDSLGLTLSHLEIAGADPYDLEPLQD